MKKNMNVIHIKGTKGLILAGFVVCCLFVGFVVFPGWVWMCIWNIMASYSTSIPSIGLFQGCLLWAILAVAYFVFRKEKVVVCMKTPQGLSEEELKAVFADIKKQSEQDPILKAMLKAREAELKVKTDSDNATADSEKVASSDTPNL